MIVTVVVAVVVGNVLSDCFDAVCSAEVGTCQGVPANLASTVLTP